MDNRREIREFLGSRRARITPEQAGLTITGTGHRRVPGLRREEVALLAGVSVDYYNRLERGALTGVSDIVLDGLARALQLDEAERVHLFDLARAGQPTPRLHRRSRELRIRPGVQRILDGLIHLPAFVRNGRLDILAANQLAHALYAPMYADPARPANLARFAFLNPRATDFYLDWDDATDTIVALLRSEAGRDPYNKDLTDLIGELSTRSDTFRTRWAAHNVHLHSAGTKHFHHPIVGDLDLAYEAMDLSADPGLTLMAYSAEPASPTYDALNLLASWSSTPDTAAP